MIFLGYILEGGDTIVGYFFLRSFFWGKCFRGRMVDIDWRGKGIGTLMNRVSRCKVIKEMDNNDMYIEVVNDNNIFGGSVVTLLVRLYDVFDERRAA